MSRLGFKTRNCADAFAPPLPIISELLTANVPEGEGGEGDGECNRDYARPSNLLRAGRGHRGPLEREGGKERDRVLGLSLPLASSLL